jgi:hypothetical protein
MVPFAIIARAWRRFVEDDVYACLQKRFDDLGMDPFWRADADRFNSVLARSFNFSHFAVVRVAAGKQRSCAHAVHHACSAKRLTAIWIAAPHSSHSGRGQTPMSRVFCTPGGSPGLRPGKSAWKPSSAPARCALRRFCTTLTPDDEIIQPVLKAAVH